MHVMHFVTSYSSSIDEVVATHAHLLLFDFGLYVAPVVGLLGLQEVNAVSTLCYD